MAPKSVLLAPLQDSMVFKRIKRITLRLNLNARVARLSPQMSMKGKNIFYSSVAQLEFELLPCGAGKNAVLSRLK